MFRFEVESFLGMVNDVFQGDEAQVQVSKDPLHVYDWPIIRLRAKNIKEVIQRYVQRVMTEYSSTCAKKKEIFKTCIHDQ